MRNPNAKEKQQINNILSKMLKTEKTENIIGYAIITTMLILFTIVFCIDRTNTPVNVIPYFVTGAIILISFFTWLLHLTLKDIKECQEIIKKNKYKVQDVKADMIGIYMTTPKSAKKLYAKVSTKKGELIDTSCDVLDDVNQNDFPKFISKNSGQKCLYIKITDYFKFAMFN